LRALGHVVLYVAPVLLEPGGLATTSYKL
jgi:hypothetical protein